MVVTIIEHVPPDPTPKKNKQTNKSAGKIKKNNILCCLVKLIILIVV